MEATRTSQTRIVSRSDIGRCPKQSWLPGHYADDGTCNCTRQQTIDAELERLNGRRRRLHREHGDVVARIRELRRTR